MKVPTRVALFLPSLSGGGAERVMLQLSKALGERGIHVDLVLVRATGPYLSQVPDTTRVVELGARKVVTSLPALVRYLRRERPDALLSTLNTANVVAVMAKGVARVPTRVVVRQAATLAPNGHASSGGAARLTLFLVRRVYRWADAIVAVSEGVAQDLAMVARLPRARIHVVPNPIVSSELHTLAQARIDHPWFTPGEPPVILGVGRLTRQKDFPTLIRAFAWVRQRRPVRLVILGEGSDRPQLEALASDLGVCDCVSLPGFVQNPFPYMAHAAVYVLSSAWEGLPGALIQALACGVPVVATDCESGPREILRDGRFGRLVPVGDATALAQAMQATLDAPVTAPHEAWAPFTDDAAIERYLRVLQADPDE